MKVLGLFEKVSACPRGMWCQQSS